MKVIVVHDAKGTIRSYAIPAPDMQDELRLEPQRGQKVVEIEVPELDQVGDPRERIRRLGEKLEGRSIQKGRLV